MISSPRAAELVTPGLVEAYYSRGSFRFRQLSNVRPVYCEKCGRHYTMLKPVNAKWAPTVVHVDCPDCGGDGTPRNLDAPR